MKIPEISDTAKNQIKERTQTQTIRKIKEITYTEDQDEVIKELRKQNEWYIKFKEMIQE